MQIEGAMRSSHQLLDTLFTSIGIACSLLIAMLSIEFLIVGNFEHVLVYTLISLLVGCIYMISSSIKQKSQGRRKT